MAFTNYRAATLTRSRRLPVHRDMLDAVQHFTSRNVVPTWDSALRPGHPDGGLALTRWSYLPSAFDSSFFVIVDRPLMLRCLASL
jgi:hypothetical protein